MRLSSFLFLLFPLFSLAQSLETIMQQGHELAVVSITVGPDSNYVVTGSKDKSAKLWELNTGREVRSFLGHESTVRTLACTRDGKILVSGSNDKTIRFWDVGTGKLLDVIQTEDIVTSVSIDHESKFLIVAGYGNSGYGDSLTVYDFKSKSKIKRIGASPDKGLGMGVNVAISPDGKWLAVGEDNRSVKIYSTSDWTLLKTINYEEGSCGGCGTRVVFDTDNKHLYYASNNGPLRKFDIQSFSIVKTYQENIEDLTGLAFSPADRTLACATEKGVSIWNTTTGDSLTSIIAPDKGEFHEITFTTNGNKLLVTSDNNTAFSWDISNRPTTKL